MDRDEESHGSPAVTSDPVQPDWRKHVFASSGYLNLNMFDEAALALEEIEPEDKTRVEVLGARVALYARPGNGTWRQRSQPIS